MEDLTQEVLCAVLSSYKRFNGRSSETTWVYGICKNVLFNYLYRQRRSHDLIRKLSQNEPERSSFELFALRWAGDRLSPPQKKLFYDFYRDATPVRSIAAQLEVPEGTVKYRLYTLRQELKRILLRN